MKLGNITIEQGEKYQGYYERTEYGVRFPVTIIHGCKPGKRVLITSGIHGCEYPGIQTAIELAAELTPDEISGQLILVHPVNLSGFQTLTPALVPEDGKNLNRVFPGNKNGTLSERIAYCLTTDFQDGSDFYLDLHGGDQQEQVIPYVYYPCKADPAVTEASRNAAKRLFLTCMIGSQATTGAYNSAALRNIPSLLIERGGKGSWSRSEVDAYKADVKQILEHLGMLNGTLTNYPPSQMEEYLSAYYINADHDGCWYPEVEPGTKITAGDHLGTVKDFFGQTLQTITAEADGCILYMTVSLSVRVGASLIAYSAVSSGEVG